ncbi:MAG: Ku protein [Clostridia bacterium]|nr:Ku protein [Clostridia bacterium]
MQTVWKGSISFGLLNVPVRMSVATARENVRFRILHRECHTPLMQKRFCPHCNREVEYEDTVRGYEYEDNKFVIISDEDLETVPVASTKTIEIVDFIKLEDVDPVYYDKTYYLRPGDGGEKPYLILRNAMRETGRVAMAKVTIRQKEHLALVRIIGNALAVETMFFPHEVRNVHELGIDKLEAKIQIRNEESEMAVKLVENLTAEFNPQKYTDDYREELLKMIRSKVDGEEIKEAAAPEPRPQVLDLMEKLRASVEATKKEEKEGKKSPMPRKKRKTI